MLFGITASILVGLTWIVVGIIMGRAPRRNINVEIFVFIYSLVGIAVSLVLGLITGIPRCSGKTLAVVSIVLFAAGVFNNLQLLFLARAMKRGPNGIIWSIAQSAFIFPFLAGVIFFGVHAGVLRWTGFAGILLGVYMMGFFRKDDSAADRSIAPGGWQFYALCAFLVTGGCQVLGNLPSYLPDAEKVDSFWRTAYCFAGMAAACPAIFVINRERRTFREEVDHFVQVPRIWKYCLILTVLEIVPSFFLAYPGLDALASAGAGAIGYPLMVGACIVGFEVFSVLFLHEKRTPVQWFALTLCLFGVAAITL